MSWPKCIALEGTCLSGKSTQAQMLYEFLGNTGRRAVLVTFPDVSTESGKRIEAYLSDKVSLSPEEALSLFIENKREIENRAKIMMSKGYYVIIDRFIHTCIVFAHQHSVDLPSFFRAEVDSLWPSHVVCMDAPTEVSVSRASSRAFAEFLQQTHQTSRESFLHAYKSIMLPSTFVYDDGTMSKEQIHNEIVNRLFNFF